MLQEPMLFPDKCQRIAALYLLYAMYIKLPLANNPFAFIFNDFLQNFNSDKATQATSEASGDWSKAEQGKRMMYMSRHEQHFLSQLINPTLNKVVMSKSPLDMISGGEGSSPQSSNNMHDHLLEFQLKLVSDHSQRSMLSKATISNVLTLKKDFVENNTTRRQLITSLYGKRVDSKCSLAKTWRPEFIRPVPPLHLCERNELLWMNPLSNQLTCQDLMWDSSSELHKDHVNHLMFRASQRQLTESEAHLLKCSLTGRPWLVLTCGRAQLQAISECDLRCAIVIINHGMKAGYTHRYLAVMISMEYNTATFRQISKLIIKYNLPHQFSNLYVSVCLDKLLQQSPTNPELVQLMLRLLQDLIKHKHTHDAIILDIRYFCLAFHKFEGVMKLWNLVKVELIDRKQTKKPTSS